MVLEKTLESPLDCKEIQPVHSKEGRIAVLSGVTFEQAQSKLPREPKPVSPGPGLVHILTGEDLLHDR